MRTEKEKMLAGEMYHAGDPEIQADQAAAKMWMVRYNASLAASATERCALLRELLSGVGDGAVRGDGGGAGPVAGGAGGDHDHQRADMV